LQGFDHLGILCARSAEVDLGRVDDVDRDVAVLAEFIDCDG